MNSPLCDMFSIDVPIFAFTHCRDVVVEVSKAGGMGVLGAAGFTLEQLKIDLDWIDQHIGDGVYGIDLLIPEKRIEEGSMEKLEEMIPDGHRAFVNGLLEEAGVPELPFGYRGHFARPEESGLVGDRPWQFLDEALGREKCKLFVNALGTPPTDIIEACHDNGRKVGAMAGKVRHAIKHREAGCDFVISVGSEAAGHTGDISTFVLLPQIVDAVAPLPVLAAGGVSTGKHVAAAMVLGAEGVWTGSLWLPTQQSELSEAQRNKIVAASSEDTVISRCLTGKTARMLKSNFTEAWEAEGAPEFLPMPLQSMLVHDASARIDKFNVVDLLTYPAGQAIGQVKHSLSVRQVMQELMTDYVDAMDKMALKGQD